VPRPDFALVLAAGFKAGAITAEEGALDTIMDLAEDVPYTVQLLARAAISNQRVHFSAHGSRASSGDRDGVNS
jgi:uncharacterized protein YbaA (DUF1428 family)